MRFNRPTGQRALYALPMGRSTNLLHVWKSLLEQARFTVDGIPKTWDAFWSGWCDDVQPAVHRATGREDVWGVGLNMSAQAIETQFQFSHLWLPIMINSGRQPRRKLTGSWFDWNLLSLSSPGSPQAPPA